MLANLPIPSLPDIALPLGGMDIAFYVVAFIMVVTALATVAVKNVLTSAIALICSFVGTAILYLLLGAEFNAIAQIMVYIGGVVIFVVFTILLTSHLGEDAFRANMPRTFAACILSAAIVFVTVKMLLPVQELAVHSSTAPEGYAGLKAFAIRLLGYGQDGFILPFEIVSVLLLATLVAAVAVARKDKEDN